MDAAVSVGLTDGGVLVHSSRPRVVGVGGVLSPPMPSSGVRPCRDIVVGVVKSARQRDGCEIVGRDGYRYGVARYQRTGSPAQLLISYRRTRDQSELPKVIAHEGIPICTHTRRISGLEYSARVRA